MPQKTSRRILSTLFLPLLLIAFSSCGDDGGGGGDQGGAAGPYPEPGPDGEIRGLNNFATLIERYSQGKVARTPWAGYWWPYLGGGIEFAVAKYDAAVSSSGAAAWERANHGPEVPGVDDWWGHCNGWAAAATLYAEPRSDRSAGGVPFTISDQKALLSEIAMEIYGDFFGRRAEGTGTPEFRDVYPNQFFLVLTNYVGAGVPLIIDRYTGFQVWNQPLAGYRIEPIRPADSLGPDPSAPNVHRVLTTMTIWWARNDVPGDHVTEPFAFADGPSFESRTLRAEIWLDAPPVFDGEGRLTRSGNVVLGRQGESVIGGAWRTGDLPAQNSYPDYLWVARSPAPSSGFTNPRVDIGWVSSQFGR